MASDAAAEDIPLLLLFPFCRVAIGPPFLHVVTLCCSPVAAASKRLKFEIKACFESRAGSPVLQTSSSSLFHLHHHHITLSSSPTAPSSFEVTLSFSSGSDFTAGLISPSFQNFSCCDLWGRFTLEGFRVYHSFVRLLVCECVMKDYEGFVEMHPNSSLGKLMQVH